MFSSKPQLCSSPDGKVPKTTTKIQTILSRNKMEKLRENSGNGSVWLWSFLDSIIMDVLPGRLYWLLEEILPVGRLKRLG